MLLAALLLVASLSGDAPPAASVEATSPAAAAALPPAECVGLLRSARLAGERGDAARELALLETAASRFPEELAPLAQLIDYHQRHDSSPDDTARLITRLVARLEDPAFLPPEGVLDQLARNPAVSVETLTGIERAIERRLAGTPGPEPALLASYVTVEEELGKFARALAALEQLYALTSASQLRPQLFELSWKLARWPEAARWLGELIASGESELRSTYVLALLRAGDPDRALVELARLEPELALDDPFVAGGYSRLLADIAWELRDAGRDADAERLFRRQVELQPGDAEARAALLHLYGSEGERSAHSQSLAEHWQEVEEPQELLDEGTQRLAAGDAAGAFDLLARAAPQLPELEAAWFNLGLAAYRLERWEAAAEALLRAAALAPANSQAQLFAGLAFVKLDRCPTAIAPLEAALRLDPAGSAVQAHYHLAQCYRALGDTEAAARHAKLYQAAKRP